MVLDDADEITPEQRKVCRRNLERLYLVIWRERRLPIRRWLVSALLNGIFSGTANVIGGMSRSILREEATKTPLFPSKLLVSQMTKRGRIAASEEDVIEKFLSMNYRKTLGFVALSLTYGQHDLLNRRSRKNYVFPAAFVYELRLH